MAGSGGRSVLTSPSPLRGSSRELIGMPCLSECEGGLPLCRGPPPAVNAMLQMSEAIDWEPGDKDRSQRGSLCTVRPRSLNSSADRVRASDTTLLHFVPDAFNKLPVRVDGEHRKSRP